MQLIMIGDSIIQNLGKVFGIIILTIIVSFMFVTFLSKNNQQPQNDTLGVSGGLTTKVSSNFSSVDPQIFKTEMELDSDAIILDIRTPQEYESGNINSAINIDYYQDSFSDDLAKMDKDAPYLIYCNSGNRTSHTLSIMKSLGFTNVVELQGGIQAWNSARLPICNGC